MGKCRLHLYDHECMWLYMEQGRGKVDSDRDIWTRAEALEPLSRPSAVLSLTLALQVLLGESPGSAGLGLLGLQKGPRLTC